MIKKILSLIGVMLFCNVLLANTNFNFTQNTPPTIFNFRIESSEPTKVYFDSDKPISGSSIEGFTISNRSISGITIKEGQSSNHYFTVSESFTFWDNNTIRYEGGSNIKDGNGTSLHEFTLSFIKNNIPEPEASQDRYVTTSASGGGDGTSEDNAWTWEEAFSKATAGTTVWIKAGNYGNLNLNIYNDGTSKSPIKFIGYKKYKGDITSNYWDYGRKWNTSEMPTLTGSSSMKGVAIQVQEVSYVVFRNLQISNYSSGIFSNTKYNSYLVFDRVNGSTFGGSSMAGESRFAKFIGFETRNNDKKYWNGALGQAPYKGNDNMKFLNIRCLNASLSGLNIFGDGNNLFEGCKLYNDRVTQPERTDYQIAFNGHNNIVRNCYVENFNTTKTTISTHGIGVRGTYNLSSNYNLIEKSEAVNFMEGLYIRNYGSDYNVIKDCKVGNNENIVNLKRRDRENTGGVYLWGGVQYNIIERVIIENVTKGIGFYDNDEESHPDTSIANNNIIRNCVINNTLYAIFSQQINQSIKGDLTDNTIINCTFNESRFIIKTSATNVQNLELINCNITKVQGDGSRVGVPNYYDKGINYKNCNFFNNNNNWHETGNGNINVDPKYVSQSDFHLSSSSPKKVTEGGAYNKLTTYDIENKFRGGKFSIGAYQFGESTTGSVQVNAGEDVEICSGEEVTLTATGNGDFSWNTGETTASITVNPEETTTYTVTVSDGDNSASDDVEVTVNEASAVDLGDDITIAPGEEVTLTAEGTGDFLWSTGDTTESITVSPKEDTTYSVTSSSCGEDATDEIKITISGVNAGEDVNICSGEKVTLTATGNGDFSWNTGETTASITVSPTEDTTYTVTLTNGESSVSDDVIVTVNAVPSVNLGDDLTINSGEKVTLTAQGVGNFLWNTGETTKSITVSPSENTTYRVTASNTCGSDDATDEINITVIVDDTSELTVNAGEDVTICSGEEITLTATGNGDFSWSTGETTASITVNPTEDKIYTVTVSKGDKSVSDEVQVFVYKTPIVDLGEDQSICYGEDVVLEIQAIGDIMWSTGQTSNRIRVWPKKTTVYSVTVTNACGTTITDEIEIKVGKELVVDAGEDKTICIGESITLTAKGTGNYKWSTGEITESITVNPTSPKRYWVTTWDGDCSVTDDVYVMVEKVPTVTLEDDKTICSGDQITLIAQGTGNFLWNTGETTSSILVSPTQTTTYSVTSTSKCSVSASDKITVTVTEGVVANAGDDVSIEAGESITLTATGGSQYLWSTGETTASITVNPNETTIYSVEVSAEGSCKGTDEVEVSIVQKNTDEVVEATVSAGDDVTICSGDSITLSATGNGSFLWSTGETSSSISVSPLSTTIYKVTATSGNTSASDEITVTVNQGVVANAGDDVSIEAGELAAVTLTATGGSQYLWSTGETTASITVQPSETTVYSVEVSAGGSCKDTDEVKVIVEDIPLTINDGKNITICIGDELILQAKGSSNYLWNTGDMESAITVKPTETTTYNVSAQKNGILETVEIVVTVENCSSNKKEDFKVYPNPTHGLVNVHLPNQKESLTISVISLTSGRLMFTKEIKASTRGVLTQLDLSRMLKGVYILKMSNDSFNETKKIIVH